MKNNKILLLKAKRECEEKLKELKETYEKTRKDLSFYISSEKSDESGLIHLRSYEGILKNEEKAIEEWQKKLDLINSDLENSEGELQLLPRTSVFIVEITDLATNLSDINVLCLGEKLDRVTTEDNEEIMCIAHDSPLGIGIEENFLKNGNKEFIYEVKRKNSFHRTLRARVLSVQEKIVSFL